MVATQTGREFSAREHELLADMANQAGAAIDRALAQSLSGITTTFEPDGIEGVRLAPLTDVQLIRVVQEALSNVRKHAQAGHAHVRFERADEFAWFTVEDDGQGFDLAQVARGRWPRFGMQSMRERVESVGGTMSVRFIQGQGTKVTVQVPIVYRGAE